MASAEPLLSLAKGTLDTLSDICDKLEYFLIDDPSETIWEGFEKSPPGSEENKSSGTTRVWVLASGFSAWTEDEKGEKRL
jgi:hypothetical protein